MSIEQQALPELVALNKIDPQSYSRERFEWLWERLKTQDYMFDDLTAGDYTRLLYNIFAPDSENFEYGNDGYVLVNCIRPKVSAAIHYAIWNRDVPIRQTVASGRSLLKYLFEKYDLNRISALIPSYHEQAVKMVILNGFKYEGALRGSHLFKGRYYDTLLYGLLREEYDKLEGTWVSKLEQLR